MNRRQFVLGCVCTPPFLWRDLRGLTQHVQASWLGKPAAAVIGAELIWMSHPDEFLFSTEATRLDFLNLVRRARPDIVLTHAPCDYHPDHRATGQILWDIRVMTTVRNIRTEAPPCEKIPEIYYYDTVAGIDFVPQFYVDVSETHSVKKQMLACHESRAGWPEDQYKISFLDFIEHTGRYRGLQCGVSYAECFQLSSTWPKRFQKTVSPVKGGCA